MAEIINKEKIKKYLIITNDIHMIGGGQLYIDAKVNYLQKNGWNVDVVYYDKPNGSKLYLKRLDKYEKNYYKHLRFPTYFYHKKRALSIIEKLVNNINLSNKDDIIIETSTEIASTWGEEIAHYLSARHIIFNLSENFEFSDSFRNFLKYKYNQNLLFGTTEQSMKNMLNDEGVEDRYFNAWSGPNIEDSQQSIGIDLSRFDYNICFFGRSDKHYVIPALLELKEYITRNKTDYFSVVMIGGTDRKNEIQQMKKIFNGVENSFFYCTGPIHPVPLSWFKNMNVVIATAGSAMVASSAGAIVIPYCVQNDRPFGIYDYTTLSIRDMIEGDTFDASLSDCLDEVLKNGIASKAPMLKEIPKWNDFDYTIIDKEFVKSINCCSGSFDYYDTFIIRKSFKEYVIAHAVSNYYIRMIYKKIKMRRKANKQ